MKAFGVVLSLLLCGLPAYAQSAPRGAQLQNAASTGNGTAMDVSGYSVVTLSIIGSAGADRVVNFEAAQDAANYVAISCTNKNTLASATSATASGTTAQLWTCAIAGTRMFRARLSGGSTGTVTVTATALPNVSTGGGGGGSALVVQDIDGAPTGAPSTLKFSNGAVTDNGDGSFTVVTGAGGGGDFSSNTATSVDSEVVLFSGAGGKTGKRATGTGLAKLTSGVLGTATAGTDYVAPARTVSTTAPLAGGGDLTADRTLTIANAAADGTTKGAASFAANDFDAALGNISLDYTNGQAASGSTKGFLTSTDWTTFNSKASGTRAINTTSPLAGGGDLSADRTLSIANAAADGSTKGAASFTANDFDATAGNISLDYTNGQAASGSTKGFLTSTDWTTFNSKAPGAASYLTATTETGLSNETNLGALTSGYVKCTVSAGVCTPSTVTQFDLMSEVFNRLPYNNLTAPSTTSRLLGRNSSTTGDWQEISLGTGLSMSAGGVLSAPGGSALTVQEIDGTPSGTPGTLKFSNGSVTDNGDGSFTVVTGAGGGGDFSSNTSTSVDSEVVLFSGTGGKTGKRATGTGIASLTSGVLGTITTSAGLSGALSDETGSGAAVFATRPTVSLQDSITTFQDDGDNTKQMRYQLSGITGGQTRTITVPDADYTDVGTTLTQTLTNKTLDLASNTLTGTLAQFNTAVSDANLLPDPGSNGMVARTGATTTANRTITGTTNEISVTNGDGVSGNPTLGVAATLDMTSKTLRVPNSTTLPGTCTTGDTYMDTDATSGQRFYLCESTNTWVKQGDGGGTGDFSSNTSSSVDSEIVLFSGTGGKTGKRATGTGLAKLTSGVLSTATVGTDYGIVANGTSGRTSYYTGTNTVDDSTAMTLDGTDILTKKDKVTAVSADTTLGAHNIVYCSPGATNKTMTLPAASSATTGYYRVIKADSGAGACLVAPNGSDTLNGVNAAQAAYTQWSQVEVTLVSSTNWHTIQASPIFGVNAQTATYQALNADFAAFKTITVASGTFTLTLVANTTQPTAGQFIKVINYGSGVVTIARSGQNINGGTTSLTLPAASATAPTSIFVVSDGTNYFASTAGVNAATATALVANGSNCSAGQFPLGVDASGAVESCTDVNAVTNTRSIYIPAGAMDVEGSCAANATAALVTNGPKVATIGCTDNDADGISFEWVMPDGWDAGTITVELEAFSIGNNNTEVFEMDFAGQCVRTGDAVAAHSTTGEQAATITWGNAANREQHATTSAITLNGTCAAGAHVYMRGQVDATATTMTPMSDLKILGVKVEYGRNAND